MPLKKKKQKKRAYLDDYKRNCDGTFSYTGSFMICAGDEKEYKKIKTSLLCISAFILALQILCGIIPAEGMLGCPYVILPYAFSFIVLVRILWAAGKLYMSEYPVKEYVFSATVVKVQNYSLVLTAFVATATAGNMVFTAINGWGRSISASICFIVLEFISMTCAVVLRRISTSVKWEKTP